MNMRISKKIISAIAATALSLSMCPATALASVSDALQEDASAARSADASQAAPSLAEVAPGSDADGDAGERPVVGNPDEGESPSDGGTGAPSGTGSAPTDGTAVDDERSDGASTTTLQANSEEMQALVDELDAHDTGTARLTAKVNEEMTYATLAASGGDFDRASSVQFPTWCQGNGQKDMRWYNAFKWEGAWLCTIPIMNHRLIGTYDVHAYGIVDGAQRMLGATSFEVIGAKADVATTPGSGDNYIVRVSPRADGAPIEAVSVASWKPANANQAGIVWVDARKQADGTWLATIPTTGANRGNGAYANHVYATCANGASSYVGDVANTFAGSEDATVTAMLDADERYATISAHGGAFAQATSVSFPVWGKPGQADIRWYAARSEGGVWTCRVDLSAHKAIGAFSVHAYGVVGGSQRFLGSTSFEVHAPSATLSLSQDRAADENAPLVATLRISSHASLVSSVSIPAWTDQGGQDDIVWYAAKPGSAAGEWVVEIPTTGAGRGAGAYLVHAYANLKNTTQVCVATGSHDVEVAEASSLSIALDADQAHATITAQGGDLARAQSVRFAVWSAIGGQDDLRWYTANRASNGWGFVVSLANHASVGTYHVHAYAIVDGRDGMRASKDFVVSAPKATGALILSQTSDQILRDEATVSLTLAADSPAAKAVQFPFWSATVRNGTPQDDIVWYDASSSDGRTWTAIVSTSGVGRGSDEYLVHAYARTANGALSYVGSASAHLEAAQDEHVSAVLDASQKSALLSASGGVFSTASAVSFPTWADPAQKDIVWYQAHRENGMWVARVDLARHRIAGTYQVHAYATADGALRFGGSASFEVRAPRGSVTITQSASQVERDEATATFSLDASSGIDPSAVSLVQFPTWTATVRNGTPQDDIAWYQSSRPDAQGGSTWSVTIPTSGVGRGSDSYIVHCYVTCANGISGFAGSATADLKADDATHFSVTLDPAHSKLVIQASGGAFSAASRVTFPTWSAANGQDDIVWYDANRSGGMWVRDVPISNHRTAGAYHVHAYATVDGAMSCAATATSDPVSGPAKATVSAQDDGRGTISVTVSDIKSLSGVKAVQVPTWTAQGGQDDIVWHTATKSGDAWVARILASDHYAREDSYISHVYVTAGNGIQGMVGMTHSFLPLRDYAYLSGAYGSGTRTVWVKNPTSSDVQVPTWSVTGGQDDIKWIRATHVGDGLYRADIDCRSLRHAGAATSHVYVGGSMIASFGFQVADSEIVPAHIRAMYDRIAGLWSRTNWLLAVDTNACTVGVFRGSQGNWSLDRSFLCSVGAWNSPTKKGDFTVGIKGYAFGHGYTCYYFTQFSGDYLFHSVKYYPGTFNIMDGRLGEHISAGCVRLHIDNAWWIYANIPAGTRVIVY